MMSWSYKTDVLIRRGKDTKDPSLLSTTQSETEQDNTGPSQERTPHPHIPPSICSVQFSCSVMSDSLRPHGLQHARPPCPSPTPGVYSTLVHQISDADSLLLPSAAINLPQHWVFSSESALHIRWPKYWSFSFSISLSNEYSGLMSYNHQIVFWQVWTFGSEHQRHSNVTKC